MNEQELVKTAIEAGIKVFVEKAADVMRATRNLAMTPFVKRKLDAALRELLLAEPNLERVERALREAQEYKFDGDELRHVRRYYRPLESRRRQGKGGEAAKAKAKRSARRKRAARGRGDRC